MRVFLLQPTGKTDVLLVQPEDTVEAIRHYVRYKTGVEPSGQRLLFAGEQLVDGQTLRQCSISGGSTIRLDWVAAPRSSSSHTRERDDNGSSSEEQRKRRRTDDVDVCAICLEVKHRETTLEPCRHTFCRACILAWLQQRTACPLCSRCAVTFFEPRRSASALDKLFRPSDSGVEDDSFTVNGVREEIALIDDTLSFAIDTFERLLPGFRHIAHNLYIPERQDSTIRSKSPHITAVLLDSNPRYMVELCLGDYVLFRVGAEDVVIVSKWAHRLVNEEYSVLKLRSLAATLCGKVHCIARPVDTEFIDVWFEGRPQFDF